MATPQTDKIRNMSGEKMDFGESLSGEGMEMAGKGWGRRNDLLLKSGCEETMPLNVSEGSLHIYCLSHEPVVECCLLI